MATAFEIKKELCDIGRRIYQNGFVAANDGNFSVKINDNEFYCTPTGVSKGLYDPGYDPEGRRQGQYAGAQRKV